MESNESRLGRSGQPISCTGDYSAKCCGLVEKFTEGQVFPPCPKHGDTEWSQIPPFVQSDFGTAAVIAHWRHLQSQRMHAVLSQQAALSINVFDNAAVNESVTPRTGGISTQTFPPGVQTDLTILLQHEILVIGGETNEGQIIEAVTPAWFAILNKIISDPVSLYDFSKYHREFEELIAGAYERDGWKVILTPHSGDKRVDIIVARRDPVEIRMVDQVKAYSPNHLVLAEDVDVMLGVLNRDQSATKGIITTTSRFAPGIAKEESIQKFIPYRLLLRDGEQLCDWISKLYRVSS
jgi:restriction system protein